MSFWTILAGPLAPLFESGSDLAKLTGVLSDFFGEVTDGKMWRSLGWLILGLITLVLGLLLLLRKPIEGAVGEVAKAVAL